MSLKLRVRRVEPSDLMLIFSWANDPLTRTMSFTQKPITLDTHKCWFKRVLSNRNIRLLVVEIYESANWHPIGQFRVNEHREVSMSLAAEYRGRHLATPLINIGIKYLEPKLHKDNLIAYIKKDNIASVKSFEKAGFHFVGETIKDGNLCLEYIYQFSGCCDDR